MDLTGSPDDIKVAAPSGPVPAPAAPRPRSFQRVLPRLKPQLNALEGWTQKTADVVIIGAGAAGLQCAERLSKSSPLLHPNGRRHHSLSVLVLEGRARLGGRIDTVPSPMPGSKIVLERGATFIHGCDHDKTNLAFNLAVRTGMRRQVKNDVSSTQNKKKRWKLLERACMN
jgi:monoamine oxidase